MSGVKVKSTPEKAVTPKSTWECPIDGMTNDVGQKCAACSDFEPIYKDGI